jgi:hypothetical protein
MTVYAPKSQNTGAAVVVFPGGGFQFLAMDLEGTEICDWLTSRGITCVLSKYRVPDTDTYGDTKCHCQFEPEIPRALQDAQRTIRLVRARAKGLNIDPNKIGVIGFSAGGYLVAQTSNIFTLTYKPVDATDKVSSRPDFAIATIRVICVAQASFSIPDYLSPNRRRRRFCCKHGMTLSTTSAIARSMRLLSTRLAFRQKYTSLRRAATPSVSGTRLTLLVCGPYSLRTGGRASESCRTDQDFGR